MIVAKLIHELRKLPGDWDVVVVVGPPDFEIVANLVEVIDDPACAVAELRAVEP